MFVSHFLVDFGIGAQIGKHIPDHFELTHLSQKLFRYVFLRFRLMMFNKSLKDLPGQFCSVFHKDDLLKGGKLLVISGDLLKYGITLSQTILGVFEHTNLLDLFSQHQKLFPTLKRFEHLSSQIVPVEIVYVLLVLESSLEGTEVSVSQLSFEAPIHVDEGKLLVFSKM